MRSMYYPVWNTALNKPSQSNVAEENHMYVDN